MELLAGVLLALLTGVSATIIGLDRDRSYYPVILVVSASYYDLFAIMSGSSRALGLETAVFAVFTLASVVGFRTNLWIVVGALVGHGVFDFAHSLADIDAGVPGWWSGFCLTYDLGAAFYMGWLLVNSKLAAEHPDFAMTVEHHACD